MLIAASAALLAGCSSTPDLDAAAAQRTYDPVVREIADNTTAAAGLRWTERSQGSVGATTSGCTWFSRSFTAETDPGSAPRWDRVIAATEATLRKHGFASATPSELKGGYTGVESVDKRGARVTIAAKGRASLQITVPVTDPC
ncbi:MAG: hypothetical protein L0H78_22805 [Humibacillus sp.]|nr:hypothetical protein [Humibacillus sp.]